MAFDSDIMRPRPVSFDRVAPLVDGANIATDAASGSRFTVTLAGNRTLLSPTNAADGMHRVWEAVASAAQRTLTLTTGAAGAFTATGALTPAVITIPSGQTAVLEAFYSSVVNRWIPVGLTITA